MQNFEGFDDLLNNESFDGTDDMDPLSGAVSTASRHASTCSAGSSDVRGRVWDSVLGKNDTIVSFSKLAITSAERISFFA